MSFRIKTHVDDNNGEGFLPDELMQEFLPPKRLRHALVGSDMDHTMFNQDLGVLVFLEKLAEPTFWHFSVERFSRLLLPNKYKNVIHEGAQGSIPELAPNRCSFVVALYHDIVNLYALQKRLKDGKNFVDIHTPAANEFARKMIEFDRVLMEMDGYLVHRFHGELLMRTRFFAGKNHADIERLTRQVMARKKDDPERHLTLRIHAENINEEPLMVTVLPDETHDRLVQPIDETRRMIYRVAFEGKAKVKVVTTNLVEIARTAIAHSTYRHLSDADTTVASTLGTVDGKNGVRFAAKMSTLPVFGPRKAEIAGRIAQTKDRVFLVALGDSPSNDGPMGKAALENNGVFVIVGNFARQHARFTPLYEECVEQGMTNTGDRMWYVEPQAL